MRRGRHARPVGALGRALLGAAALVAGAGPAHAAQGELFGLGSRWAAMGGASTAAADDAAAAYYNPAGLAALEGPRATVGFADAASRLHVADRRQAVRDSFGFLLGVATPVPLGGPLTRRLFVGVEAFLPPGLLILEGARAPADAYFPLFDNRTQRLVLLPALAVRVTDALSVGVGADVLARLSGEIRTSEGATRSIDASVGEELLITATPAVGVRWTPRPALTLGATWRAAFSVPFDTTTRNRIAGAPLDLDLSADTLYTPALWALGAAVRPRERLLVTADVVWRRWSRFDGGFVSLDAVLPFSFGNQPSVTLRPELPAVDFHDTLSPRAGVEWTAASAHGAPVWTARGGLAFEPTPVPRQGGVTNLADSDRWVLAGGGGVDLGPWLGLEGPLRVDAHVMWHVLRARESTKDAAALPDESAQLAGLQTTNAGYPVLRSGGSVVAWGATLTFCPP